MSSLSDHAKLPPQDEQIVRFLSGLWQLNRRIKADVVPLLEPLGLDLRLYLVLMAIRKGARHPGTIAQQLDFPASLLSRYLETLRRLGYTERQPDPDDSRRVLLSLSPAGDAALSEVLASLKRRTAERLEELTPERLSDLLDVIELLASPQTHARSSNSHIHEKEPQ